jgi:hypothetical protein
VVVRVLLQGFLLLVTAHLAQQTQAVEAVALLKRELLVLAALALSSFATQAHLLMLQA